MQVSICLCVCTRSVDGALQFIRANRTVVSLFERRIILVNGPQTPESLPNLNENDFDILLSKRISNLSAARNHVLESSTEQYILYADDDVRLNVEAVRNIRAACEAGFDVVGAKLLAPTWIHFDKWFFSSGQYHYLGLHRPDDCKPPVWGACMCVSQRFISDHKLRFRDELGRSGVRLQSGDDSTFIREVLIRGGLVSIPPKTAVQHEIAFARLSFFYLFRRAFWQGRSEVRRNCIKAGLIKEFERNLRSTSRPIKTLFLVSVYCSAVILGIAVELLCRILNTR